MTIWQERLVCYIKTAALSMTCLQATSDQWHQFLKYPQDQTLTALRQLQKPFCHMCHMDQVERHLACHPLLLASNQNPNQSQ